MEDVNMNLVTDAMFKALFPKHDDGGESVLFMETTKKYNRIGFA